MYTLTITFGNKALASIEAEVRTFNSVKLDEDSSNANLAAFWTRILDGKGTATFTLSELSDVRRDTLVHMLAGSGKNAGEMAFATAYVMKQIVPAVRKGETNLQAKLAFKGE